MSWDPSGCYPAHFPLHYSHPIPEPILSARTPNLFVSLDPENAEPAYRQISQAIRQEIHSGRLRPGDPLPGYRTLGESLGISRNTVMAAYKELHVEGWILSTQGEGSMVAPNPPPWAWRHGRYQ